ncbi:MAG: hypothetical protein ABSC53_14515 [Bacteroidota bacterium]
MGRQENKLWIKAKYSLEKHYGYICANPDSKRNKLRKGFINIGLGGIIPDVIGIKEVGNQYEPHIEIIAVEVKENLPNYRERHMDQVRRASEFAHKVFLAVPREFKSEEVELAVEHGIGLFELNSQKNRLKLIVPSTTFEPSESKIIELMRRLEYFKCGICNCYWNKNLIDVFGYRPIHLFSKRNQTKFVKFICEKCSEKLLSMMNRELKDNYAEDWKLARTDRRLERLTDKNKLLSKKTDLERAEKRHSRIVAKVKEFPIKRDLLRLEKKIEKQSDNLKKTKRQLREAINKKTQKSTSQLRRIKNSLRSI